MPYSQQQRRMHIKELQKMLYGISMYDSRVPEVVPDGIYGKITAFAVKSFQQTRGLRPTGDADHATWERIKLEYTERVEKCPKPVDAFPHGKNSISEGDTGLCVYMLQAMLDILSGSFSNIPSVSVTGVYDRQTEYAVKMFQKICGQPPTGCADTAVWNLITAAVQTQ